ncbi:ATP12 family protein [Mesorhizobium sp. WSM2239]|uniref:ATP12 family protein n=2 Tax=unclassified Mesorhizobium TaxID=325217 RepID=A0AAU8D5H2_9HYPH
MRDLLNDLDAQKYLSDPDPIRRAQSQMKTQLPKRFYKDVSIAPTGEGFGVHLDGRPVRTPGKAILALPTEKAAKLVAEEFAAQGEKIDPSTMPVYRLVNTAIDGVAADPAAVRDDVARFASSDLLCYRADAPAGLVERQATAWDPVLDWAQRALGARLLLAQGVIHVEQPRKAVEAIEAHLALRQNPLRLAALHLMTTLTGSALLAIAVEAGEIDAETAWSAAHVDEDWQTEQWGQDSEAMARRAYRKHDMMAAARLLEALER